MNIKEARELSGYTRKQVEAEFGVPWRSIQNWENGDRQPPKYVEEYLVEKLLQVKRKARICVKDKMAWIETLSDNGVWELYASYQVTELPGQGLVVPAEMLRDLQKLSDEKYSLIWD